MAGKKIAITGATGFLGRHVCQAVYSAGHIPIAVVRKPITARALFPSYIEIRNADILNADALVDALSGCHAAIHLAGMVSLNKCDKDQLYKVNIEGAKNFINAFQKNNIKQAIFTSSTSAVAALTDDNSKDAFDEAAFFNLSSLDVDYIKAKRSAHILALDAQDNDLPITILSPSFVLGPDDINSNTSSLIDAIRRRALPVFPNGGINPIDVRDVARAYVAVLNHPDPARHYILASTVNISLKDFTRHVAKIADVPTPLFSITNKMTSIFAHVLETISPRGDLTVDGAKLSKLYWYFNAALARKDLSLKCRALDATIYDTLHWLIHKERTNILKFELEKT